MKTVNIDGKEYVLKTDIPKARPNVRQVQDHPYTVGEEWFIQTATLYYAGTLKAVTENELVLEDAAWVADTGRFHQFMKDSVPKELEPCGLVIINRGAIVAALPRPKLEIVVL